MLNYRLNEETKDKIKEFLKPALESNQLLVKEELTTDEINQLLSHLGKFPAAIVYSLIEDLKNGLNVEGNEGTGE